MIFAELFILILLVASVVWAIRSGKSLVKDDPVVIHHPGIFHLTLAPQLDHAQPFIERIAAEFAATPAPQGDLPSLYYEIRDPQLPFGGYLLAIARRGGTLYFQAIHPPRDAGSHLGVLREFSEAVLALHPLLEPVDMEGAAQLRATVESVAAESGIFVKSLGGIG